MPTGAGKTFIAELAILKALTEFPDKKCIYITPFRTLTNEVKDTLSKNLNKLNFVVSNVIGSYEIDESQTILIEKSDVIIATPEKIDLLFRTDPEFFENISIVIIDEGHITTIAVKKDYLRNHIGEAIIHKILEDCYENGVKYLTLEVRASNIPAIKLYEKYGFQSLGTRKGYYQDNNEDALIMWTENIFYDKFKQKYQENIKTLKKLINIR